MSLVWWDIPQQFFFGYSIVRNHTGCSFSCKCVTHLSVFAEEFAAVHSRAHDMFIHVQGAYLNMKSYFLIFLAVLISSASRHNGRRTPRFFWRKSWCRYTQFSNEPLNNRRSFLLRRCQQGCFFCLCIRSFETMRHVELYFNVIKRSQKILTLLCEGLV